MFFGDERLRHANETYEYSEEEILELVKCRDDITYFAEKYCYIITLSRGKQLIDLYPFQYDLLKYLVDTPAYDKFAADGEIRNNNILFTPRQVGKSVMVVIYALHFALFNRDKSTYMLSNDMAGALDLMARLTLMYEMLPQFMQVGLVELNKKTMVFGNGSSVRSKATTPSAIRGRAVNLVLLDEYAFIPDSIANDFKKSVFPTIVSADNPLDAKIVIISTANGLNHYFHDWQKAKIGKSSFVPFEIAWNEVPGRDEKWKEQIIRDHGREFFEQEFACFSQDSTIELLNKDTGIEFKLTMKELFDMQMNSILVK